MSYEMFFDFIKLLKKATYLIMESKFDKSVGCWYITFRSTKRIYKVSWDLNLQLMELNEKVLFNRWSLIIAYSEINWTPKDLLLFVESQSLFKKNKHDINLMRSYPVLPKNLERKLNQIPQSICDDFILYPCQVKLKNSNEKLNVYLTEYTSYIKSREVVPRITKENNEIDLLEIEDLTENPQRLPVYFANKLYKAGETQMGYITFTLIFKDDSVLSYHSNTGALDFISLPSDKKMSDIIDVIPHRSEQDFYEKSLKYYWCLFSKEKQGTY